MSFSWLLILAIPFAMSTQGALAATSDDEADLPQWPRQITTDEWVVTAYQPQADHFADDILEARAAVAIKPVDGSAEPVFGAVWVSARLDIDREQRVIKIRELSVPEVRLADVSEEQRNALARLLETEIPKWEFDLDMDLLVADLDEAVGYATTPGIKAEPPQILHSNEPAVLNLAGQGIEALVLDDNDKVSWGSRAVCYAKRPLEILDRLGCGHPMVEKGVEWNLGKVYFDERLVYDFNLLSEDGHEFPALHPGRQYGHDSYR